MKSSPDDSKLNWPVLLSWTFYDFANTIFSAVALTAYFPVYFTKLAGANWFLGAASTSAMILAGLIVPVLGALSDQTGKAKRYLLLSTLACIFFFFLLGIFKTPWLLLAAFALSCFTFHASLVFYNCLLPMAAPPEKQGFASGLGTGLGYLGVVITLPMARLTEKMFGTPAVFPFSALMFFLFSLPLFLKVPERIVAAPERFSFQLWKKEWKKILALFREMREKPELLCFFAGNFFVVDALNTMILWFSVYAARMYHPAQGAIITLLIGINFSAFIAGILAGFLTDKIGALKMLSGAAALLAVSILCLTLAPTFAVFMAVSLTGGAFAIAGVWTAGRKVLLEFAPADKVGEYFGLYGLVTKISVIGNLVFSIVADLAGFKIALRTLLFPSLAGFFFLILCGFYRKRQTS